MKSLFFCLFSAMTVFCASSSTAESSLTLRFTGIEKPGGTVRLALYKSKADFMKEDKAVLYNFKAYQKGTLEGLIENLPVGSYAFAVFLDENDNMELDKNLFGVPTEPYGFSKIPPSKWRLPKWEEVKFELGQNRQTLEVSLKKWALL